MSDKEHNDKKANNNGIKGKYIKKAIKPLLEGVTAIS